MKRVALFLHGERPEAVSLGRSLAETLAAHDVEVVALPDDAARLATPDVAAAEDFPGGADLVLVLGGDGSLLRAAALVHDSGTPILGVNLGRLGFLSELDPGEIEAGLGHILEHGFDVEERMILVGELVDGEATTPLWALNDVIVEKVAVGRAIKLSVEIAGEPFVSWAADGVIIATSTGSTAYSFSAGGPIVSPRIDAIVITPVSPHGLFARTVLVPPGDEVVIRLLPDPDIAHLSADGGPALPLSSTAEVRLRTGKDRIRLAKVDGSPFWRLVREKFRLPEMPK